MSYNNNVAPIVLSVDVEVLHELSSLLVEANFVKLCYSHGSLTSGVIMMGIFMS